MERPILDRNLDGSTFRNYYYLKEELVAFCRQNGLPVSGGKPELTERIARFLDTGEVLPPKPKKSRAAGVDVLTEDMVIGENFVCSEASRAFFKERLGKSFTFNVPFQQWLKANSDKTCGDAVAAYQTLKAQRKTEKTEIGAQFEYNTYIRDFFAANSDRSLTDAICCWNYKKQQPGHNRYEPEDLIALEQR